MEINFFLNMDWPHNPFARARAFFELLGLESEFGTFLEAGWLAFCKNASALLSETELSTTFEPALEEGGELHRVLTSPAGVNEGTPQSLSKVSAAMFDVFDQLSLEMVVRLRHAFRLTAGSGEQDEKEEGMDAAAAAASSPPREDASLLQGGGRRSVSIAEQYVVDAIDAWMARRDEVLNKQLVVAVGVSPQVVDAAVAARGKEEVPSSELLADFVIEIVLPADHQVCGTSLDWLYVVVEKNAALDVDDDEAIAALPPSPPQKRPRCTTTGGGDTGAISVEGGDDDEVLDGGQGAADGDDDDDLIVTHRNIDQLMMTRPQLLPRYVIVEKRKSLEDLGMTVFEAEHHYTVAELREFIRTQKLDVSSYKGLSKKSGLAGAVIGSLKAKREAPTR